MNEHERITVDPNILVGKPVIRGTRLSVALIVQLLANGWDIEGILQSYPGVQREDILACPAYAAHVSREHAR